MKPTAMSLLQRLASAVSEQQFTLNSQGWNTEGLRYDEQWSKAGARRFQFDEIEQVLREITAYESGLTPEEYLQLECGADDV